MSFLVYYLLHLCVTMHACNSRHLGVFHKDRPGKEHLAASKAPQIMAELQGRNINEIKVKQKESKLDQFLYDEENMHKGSDHMKVQISQEEIKIEGWKNHGPSAMESKPQDSNEDINNSKDNSVTEDVVVMDYAQPHRKPPIHNLEP